MKASVKIMLSYNYCHFEICLASDEDLSLKEVNELRKKAQRLADEAVRQYVVCKDKNSKKCNIQFEKDKLMKEVDKILLEPESEWTAEEKAKVKAIEDSAYWSKHNYNYEDDDLEFN